MVYNRLQSSLRRPLQPFRIWNVDLLMGSVTLLISAPFGLTDGVQAGDPIFILRRDAVHRHSNRHSVPLDDGALHRLRRDSMQSAAVGDETPTSPKPDSPNLQPTCSLDVQ